MMIGVNNRAVIVMFMLCLVMVYCKTEKNNTMVENTEDLKDTLLDLINNYSRNEFKEENERESRKEKSSQDKQELLKRILPMLAMPFIMQTTFLPMVLLGIKFMLLQSIFMGKLAVIFWAVMLIKNMQQDKQGQFYSHNIHLGHH